MTTGEFRERDLTRTDLELAFSLVGVMGEIARAGVEESAELTPDEVGEVILPSPPAGERLEPRFQLLDNSKAAVREAANEHENEVFTLAERLGMRRSEALSGADIARIQLDQAVWAVEGGANRTSVVRRALAIEAMRKVYGEEANKTGNLRLFQFGSGRQIPRERNGKPNAEYAVAREIIGDRLLDDDSLTEFRLNLLGALQDGWKVADLERETDTAELVMHLRKGAEYGALELVLVQPKEAKKGLKGELSAVAELTGSLEGKQLVIATNGQYRPKSEAQANQWAEANGVEMLPPVAIGDEPGYKVQHAGTEIVTGERASLTYVNEIVVLKRLLDSNQHSS